MKLHRSFGKALAVATIAFMILSAASAEAQQRRSGQDRCFRSERVRPAVRGRMVPPVYMYPVRNAERPYRDYRTGERPLFTGQRGADMGAAQKALNTRRLQLLGALKSQLEILVRAQPRPTPRTLQPTPTMPGSQEPVAPLVEEQQFNHLNQALSRLGH